MKTVDVLLVEDNAGDALLTGQTLSQCSVAVKLHIARDGEQALMMLSDPDFQPELIILDLNLPKISGIEMLKRMSRKEIPVVVFSSSWNEVEIERVLGHGVRDFVQKPTDIDAFTAAVCGIIDKWAAPPDINRANGAAS
ncbi:MAG TPA: response regulator [Bryobacteraceae bacterium]|nr:response regulator [Bryobacteraceae bacterium]